MSPVSTTSGRAGRLATILDELARQGEVSVPSLSAQLGVTSSTLRRDLALLESQDLLTRTHGGAIDSRSGGDELPVRYREGHADEEKAAIARTVAAMVPPGRHTVGLTGGTTTSAVARVLGVRDDLTVVTNAVNIAADLAVRARARVFLAGGFVRPQSYEVVGPSAAAALSSLTLSLAFIGVDGVSAAAGLTTHDEVEAQTNQAMLRRAHRVVVVADGRKVGLEHLACISPLSGVHALVTTSNADPEELDRIARAGVKVTVVDPTSPSARVG